MASNSLKLAAALLTLGVSLATAATNCSSSAIPRPSAFGTEILNVTAQTISSFYGINDNDICLINVTLTHPGTGDRVHNWYALPLSGWNGRFQGIGGGGYAAGSIPSLAPQSALGYSAGTTDAGHDTSDAAVNSADSWALLSTGNVNQNLLLNFAHRSLHDMTVIGKQISESFYGCPVKYSYWNGCSTGGRQGMAMAQYYPSDYDGILANAPAMQWTDFTMEQQWPYTVQNVENYTVAPCEFYFVVTEIVNQCDSLDGLVDGMISAPGLCHFNASNLVGKPYKCTVGSSTSIGTFSQEAAVIVNKILQGPRTPQNQWLWYGLPPGANFSSQAPNIAGNNTPQPFQIPDSWIRGFIAKNLSFSTASVSYAEFSDIFLQSHIQFDSIIGTYSPDLRPFANRGGKLITWQGLADALITPQGTQLYYEKVRAIDPTVEDFYRQFYSPGVGHCGGGSDLIPTDPIGQLRAWVENGTAPAYLRVGSPYAINASSDSVPANENVRFLDLCPYPQVTKYKGAGDPAKASSYYCAASSGWYDFGGPSGSNYSCVGGPGWYGSSFPVVEQ